jgi:hypothetical protein
VHAEIKLRDECYTLGKCVTRRIVPFRATPGKSFNSRVELCKLFNFLFFSKTTVEIHHSSRELVFFVIAVTTFELWMT